LQILAASIVKNTLHCIAAKYATQMKIPLFILYKDEWLTNHLWHAKLVGKYFMQPNSKLFS